ncbi:hypothetical protein [Bacillus paranthracis]|uniref:hypothetical protein n=1 Tax=Bacillus paranthracis TaxID=2026186 RepID=UPI0013D5596F|nr:hypothetical protein [Bacillus paranthracis]
MFVSRKQNKFRRKLPAGTRYNYSDIDRAASNGISRELLKQRLDAKWSIDRATTQPPRKYISKQTLESVPL